MASPVSYSASPVPHSEPISVPPKAPHKPGSGVQYRDAVRKIKQMAIQFRPVQENARLQPSPLSINSNQSRSPQIVFNCESIEQRPRQENLKLSTELGPTSQWCHKKLHTIATESGRLYEAAEFAPVVL